jgi:hypothetical protein
MVLLDAVSVRAARGADDDKVAAMGAASGEQIERVSALLHEAGETHHGVYRIVDGADDDWATWYSWWLTTLSELPDLLGTRPVRSELTYLLVALDKEYSSAGSDEPWERYYASRVIEHFTPAGTSSP